MPVKVDKVVVTNLGALGAKYGGAGVAAIRHGIAALVRADHRRGLVTRLLALDDTAAMAPLSARPVTQAHDPAQNKRAIDAVYRALAPDYVLLLGATDVIPHVDLHNPLFSSAPDGDPDRHAYGDLPYACEAPYSQRPRDFLGPTRVVGRLPDVTGGHDARYLLGLLRTAAAFRSSPAARYERCFGLSAQIWKASTRQSLTATFGPASVLRTVPPSRASWPASVLRAPMHFVNCHGDDHATQFFGQPASGAARYPVALDAAWVKTRIARGTVASAECCYGGQLFDPAATGGQAGICNTYLARGAYAFFASTTIAYGPESGNDSADLLCQYFLQSVLAGASIGRATLEARQRFLRNAKMSDPDNLKTIAQFNVYGDPALTPVTPAHGAPTKSPSAALRVSEQAARQERRRRLFRHGVELATAHPTLHRDDVAPRGAARATMHALARRFGVRPGTTLAFRVRPPRRPPRMPPTMAAQPRATRVYVVFHAAPPARRRVSAIVVHEIAGRVASAKKIVSR